MAKTELSLPKGITIRGKSIQAKASVTINGKEQRPTKAFKFVDVKKVQTDLSIAEAIAEAVKWKAETVEALTLGKEIKVDQRKEYTLLEGSDYTYNQV